MSRRIRTTRPELLELAAFAGLTDAAARLMHALPILCDDEGRCPAAPSFIAGAVFFARQKQPHVIGQLLKELEEAKLIRTYATGAGKFLEVSGWSHKDHPNYQFIKRRQQPRYPAPTDLLTPLVVRSETRSETTDLDQGIGNRERDPAAAAREVKPPPAPRPPGEEAYDPEDPRSRGRLAEIKYAELSARRIALAERKGWPRPLPLPLAGGGVETQGFRDLRDRIREEGAAAPSVIDAMFDALEAEDAKNGELRWFSELSLGAKAWRNTRGKLAIGPRKPPARAEVRDEDDWPSLEDLANSPWAPPPGYSSGGNA